MIFMAKCLHRYSALSEALDTRNAMQARREDIIFRSTCWRLGDTHNYVLAATQEVHWTGRPSCTLFRQRQHTTHYNRAWEDDQWQTRQFSTRRTDRCGVWFQGPYSFSFSIYGVLSPLRLLFTLIQIQSKHGSGFLHALYPSPEFWSQGLDHRTEILYATDIRFVPIYQPT